MNEARVPITPSPGADFRTQVLTLAERLVLAAEENEPLRSCQSGGCSLVTRMLQDSHFKGPKILCDCVKEDKW